MPTTELGDIQEMPITSVRQNQEVVAAAIEESNPYINAQRGVVASLLSQPQAVVETRRIEQLETLRRSLSILRIQEDPALADDELVDAAASNFGKVRLPGASATGEVTVVVRTLEPVVVPAGTIFETGAAQFVVPRSIAARTIAADVLSADDRVLFRRVDGTYSFSVPVDAVAIGVEGQIAKDTQLTPTTNINNFIKAMAAVDFTGGVTAESNEQLVARLSQGVTAKTLAGSNQMVAALYGNDSFGAEIVDDSLIGFGDPEMRRDRSSLVPFGVGGRTDWYVQTRTDVLRTQKTLPAVLLSRDNAGNTRWQLTVTQGSQIDDNAVWYRIESVKPADAVETSFGSFVIESQTRVKQPLVSEDYDYPEVMTIEQAAFSMFQHLSIIFVVPVGQSQLDWEVGDLLAFAVELIGQPRIPEIQQTYSSPDAASTAGDLLIKAPIPCLCRFEATLQTTPAYEEALQRLLLSSLTTLTEAAAKYSFTGFLPIAKLLQTLQQLVTLPADVIRFSLHGELLLPDGTRELLSGRDGLTVPDNFPLQVSGRTVAFFLSGKNILLNTSVR